MSKFQENITQADDPRLKLVDRAMKRLQYQPDALIEVLHTAQEAYGYLSRAADRQTVPERWTVGRGPAEPRGTWYPLL